MAKPKTLIEQLQHDVESYIDQVLSGTRPAGKLEKLALERHQRDLAEQFDRGEFFSWPHAQHHCGFFGQLIHPKGSAAGKPFILAPTHKTLVALGFGWRRVPERKSDPFLRRFREMYLSMARGGAKSPLAAGFLLQGGVADYPPEPGAENVCAATTRSQATKYVWSATRDYIKKIEELREVCKILASEKVIEFELDGITSTISPLGSDSNNLDGGNYHIAVVDELHAFREQHRGLIEVINTAMGKRLQDLLVYITTAGSDRSTIWKEIFDYARKVLEGIVEDRSYFAYILSCDEDDDPWDESTWCKANPLMFEPDENGELAPWQKSSIDKMRAMALKAKHSPSKLNELNRFKRNLLVSDREKPFPAELISRGGELDLERLRGVKCAVGIDLGWRDDLAAAVACFELTSDSHKPEYAFLTKAWMPEDCERRHQMPFESFQRQGLIELCYGETNDDDDVLEWILSLQKLYGIKSIAADGSNFRSILNRLNTKHGLTVYEFPQQPYKYNEPVRKLAEFYRERRLLDGKDPLLRWALDNVTLRKDKAGNVMPDKKHSIEKIDPACAALMALSECLYDNKGESVYESRGIRTL